MKEVVYLGIKGHVAAIEIETGRERWRTQVRSNSSITNVAVVDEVVLVYARGHLFGLRKETGKILWENELSGLGYGYGILGVEGGQGATLAAAAAKQQAAAAAGAAGASAAAASASS